MATKSLPTLWRWLDMTRRVIVNLIFVIILIGILAAILAQRPRVPEGGALVLDPSGVLVEQIASPYPPDLLLGAPRVEQALMRDLLDAIDIARDDKRIRLMVLDLGNLGPASLSKLRDLRKAIKGFKASGKRVIVAADYYTQGQYYLASIADEIYLHPMGMVTLTGLDLYRSYFKDALDRLNIDMHVFTAGEYKSAAEPLTRNDMSPRAREANSLWLNQLWDSYEKDVTASRGISREKLHSLLSKPSRLLQRYKGNLARLAKDFGLVDALATRQEVKDHLIKLVGKDKENGTFRQISYKAYLQAVDGDERHVPMESRNKIAIVVASGTILDGEQPAGMIGGDSLAAILRSARANDDIKAVVLRVDSPGGSALASELIRREVENIKLSGKPVVVSMGSLAASGGYWISMAADEIWASPITLTGSIGVIGLLPKIHRGLDKLGIHTDGIGTSPIAGAMRPDRPMNPEIAQVMRESIDYIYSEFVRKAADGRGMEVKQLDRIARGRVWSGMDALEAGLVDKLGGLDDAVASAAERAGISSDYEVMYLEKKRTFREILLEDLLGSMEAGFGFRQISSLPGLEPLSSFIDELRLLTSSGAGGVYAYCPCGDVRIK